MVDITIQVISLLVGVPGVSYGIKKVKNKLVEKRLEEKHLLQVSDKMCSIYEIEGYKYDKRKIVNRVFQNKGYSFFNLDINYTDIVEQDITRLLIISRSKRLIWDDDNKKIIGNRIKIKLYKERESQLDEQILKLKALLDLLNSESVITNMNIEEFLLRNIDLQDIIKEIYYLNKRIIILERLYDLYNIKKYIFHSISFMMNDSNYIINSIESVSKPFFSEYKSGINSDFMDTFEVKKYKDEDINENHKKECEARNNTYRLEKEVDKYNAIKSRLEFILNQSILEAEANKEFGLKTKDFIDLEEIKTFKEEYAKKFEEEDVNVSLPFTKSLVLGGEIDTFHGQLILNNKYYNL